MWSAIWSVATTRIGFWTWIWSTWHCGLGHFNAGKTQLVLFDCSNGTGAINVKMDGSVLVENLSFKMLGLTSSSKLDWGSKKTASKKIGKLDSFYEVSFSQGFSVSL